MPFTLPLYYECFSGFVIFWTDLMVQHKSWLSVPAHAAAMGSVIVRQANGMENAAFEVSLSVKGHL